MRFLLILFISLTFAVYASGQNAADSGFTNKAEAKNLKVKGVKQGKWVEYRDTLGKITSDTHRAVRYNLIVFKDGEYNGIMRDYGMDNDLNSEAPYTKGILNGIEKLYMDGKLWVESPYINGELSGLRKIYHHGNVYIEMPFDKGIENGEEKRYYESGKLMSETLYTNGAKGITKEYDENGKEIN